MKKNILLIGGSSGIGLSLVNQISQDHNVYVACRSNNSLPENVNYIKEKKIDKKKFVKSKEKKDTRKIKKDTKKPKSKKKLRTLWIRRKKKLN